MTMAIEIDGGRLAPQWLFGFWVFIDSVKVGGRLMAVDWIVKVKEVVWKVNIFFKNKIVLMWKTVELPKLRWYNIIRLTTN